MLLLLACAPMAPAPTIRERFGEWVFLTPRDAPASVGLFDGGSVPTDPATCGACHAAVYAEWQETTHAAAAGDLQYLAELSKPTSPRWLCLNCHVPTVPQRPHAIDLDTRLAAPDQILALEERPNPAFVPERAGEAIGCATCHVRRDPDGVGTVLGPGEEGSVSPHRVRRDRAALDAVCIDCHSPGEVTITPQFWCWFHTADELAQSKESRGCVDCHMPSVERPLTATSPPRRTRHHHWVGGGVPKSYEGYDTLLARGWEPGFEAELQLGEVARVSIRNRAGHALPTGDPERHLRVELRALDAAGAPLAQARRRIGQRWDWGDPGAGKPAVRLADERVAPDAEWSWSWTPPAGTAAVELEILHVRVEADTAAWFRKVEVLPELRPLRPEAQPLMAAFDEHYPLASFVWAERVDRAGQRLRVPAAELVARSKALAQLPLDQKKALLAVE